MNRPDTEQDRIDRREDERIAKYGRSSFTPNQKLGGFLMALVVIGGFIASALLIHFHHG